MKNKDKVVKAIILAGGFSRRMGLRIPKQLVKIGNKPLLAHTLEVFERCNLIDSIILVVYKRIFSQCQSLIKKYGYTKIEKMCLGGRTRQQSVFNALNEIRDCDFVIIHDGVRPLVSQRQIREVIKAVKKFGAVTCAVRAVDTIVETKDNFINKTLCRDRLWHIQTPQAFRLDLICQAHQVAKDKKIFAASDDAQLLLRLKKKVKLVEASYKNIKITTPLDLDIFANILRYKK